MVVFTGRKPAPPKVPPFRFVYEDVAVINALVSVVEEALRVSLGQADPEGAPNNLGTFLSQNVPIQAKRLYEFGYMRECHDGQFRLVCRERQGRYACKTTLVFGAGREQSHGLTLKVNTKGQVSQDLYSRNALLEEVVRPTLFREQIARLEDVRELAYYVSWNYDSQNEYLYIYLSIPEGVTKDGKTMRCIVHKPLHVDKASSRPVSVEDIPQEVIVSVPIQEIEQSKPNEQKGG